MVSDINIIKSRLSMRHIRLLIALSQKKSLKLAAKSVNLTQPAVTKTLQSLEDTFGEQLFIRTSRGLVPNMLGEAAIQYANTVFADLQALHTDLKILKGGGMGNIRIGCMPSQANSFLARVISRLKQEAPRINIAVIEDTSDNLLKQLENDQIDLTIARIPQGWPQENLVFEELGDEKIELAVRADHPMKNVPEVSFRDLLDFTWIVQPEPAPLRAIYNQCFREAQLPLPRSNVETASTLLTASLLQSSDTITLLPNSLILFYAQLGLMSRLAITIRARLSLFGLIYRQDRIATPPVELAKVALRTEGLLI